MHIKIWSLICFWVVAAHTATYSQKGTIPKVELKDLKKGFHHPPNSAKPGVYWYFMDGNLSKEAMTADLESMKAVGIGSLIFLEVNVGVPRGKVDFLSPEWQDLFVHAVHEAERLGIAITLGVGPGWTGSGGPWVRPAESMQHLVSSTVQVAGGHTQQIKLPVPAPHRPYFGEDGLTESMKEEWRSFYKDVHVLAFPTPLESTQITDIGEKALVFRAPFTSVANVKPHLLPTEDYPTVTGAVRKEHILDLTSKMSAEGVLTWDVPTGNWTIMRFVSRNNGASTRPAPYPGLGFESDKMDTVALNAHLDRYVGTLIKKMGGTRPEKQGGLKRLHMDSWEMGAQNWTALFREEFMTRRGYDPIPYYPVYAGVIVESVAISERFLWDLRQTAQELVLEKHAGHIKTYGKRLGLTLSIEPYDMNPTSDLELGAIADVPMAEFWSKGYGFDASFSVFQAPSIAHINGTSLVPAEAFTAQNNEGWKLYPGNMKNQTDWALAAGINQLVFHTFQHQNLPDSLRPGMTMGPYGVQWNRNQTWWPMVHAYHAYLARAQFLLQQGRTVADIVYLAPEGSPHVFLPPGSAIEGEFIPDRKGYNFDACAATQLYKAFVKNGRITFPGGASYAVLVLPYIRTMTPKLLEKIEQLLRAGAHIVGPPPLQSPSLSDYGKGDDALLQLAKKIWGGTAVPTEATVRKYGKGRIYWGGKWSKEIDNLYPSYENVATLLRAQDHPADFQATSESIRYTHRTAEGWDLYFVSNRSDRIVHTDAVFRSVVGKPQLWDPVQGIGRALPEYQIINGQTKIPLQFEPSEGYFIVFAKGDAPEAVSRFNFAKKQTIMELDPAWDVSFDSKWGGPAHIRFDKLQDWSSHGDKGIKYYSGSAKYRKRFTFTAPLNNTDSLWLDLGEVCNIARVKLNGQDLGIVWTAPWNVNIGNALQTGENLLEIEVINLWPNRLIGDEQLPADGVDSNGWPTWLNENKPRTNGRFTFTTYRHYNADSPLLKSGLLGPVRIVKSEK